MQRKHKLFILITLISIISLIFIQFWWIYESSQTEQRLFANKVELALVSAKNDIAKEKYFCQKMDNCFKSNSGNCRNKISIHDWRNIDSIIKKNMKLYNIDLEYNFDILDKNTKITDDDLYTQSLEEILETAGIQLSIHFPTQNEFFFKQVSTMFVISIILILIISFSLLMMLKFYNKEKSIYTATKNFIDNMTHEFKTPLANIGLANNMLMKKISAEQQPKIQRYTDIIAHEKSKLTQNVEQILNISTLEKQNILIQTENIELKSVIHEAIAENQLIITEKNGTINVSENFSNDQIIGNKLHLTNLFSNIIDNAIKYCSKLPEINIDIYNKENFIVVQIADNGIGIAKEHSKHIFDKFYRIPTNDVHDNKGFGIGLNYVKTITDLHKGKIDLKSIVNKGSIFYVFLPIIISKNEETKNK